jgi:Fe-S-cluster containining protein
MATAARKEPEKRTKPRREDLGPDEVLCFHCPAKCCRYFALPIDPPTDWEDFEYIRWYLLHERATVFTEDDNWYLLVHNVCKMLGADNLCQAYETRPQICRDYTTENCEYEDEWVYDHYFETHEQVLEYAEAVLGPKEGKNVRSPRRGPLAIVATGN